MNLLFTLEREHYKLDLLKSPDFRLLVIKCAGSYSRVFTVPQKADLAPQKFQTHEAQ